MITESATIRDWGTDCSKQKNPSAVPTGRCDVVSDWAVCSVTTTVTPHRRVRACQLDGRDGLEERSARGRLSQLQCRVGWVSANFENASRTRDFGSVGTCQQL